MSLKRSLMCHVQNGTSNCRHTHPLRVDIKFVDAPRRITPDIKVGEVENDVDVYLGSITFSLIV